MLVEVKFVIAVSFWGQLCYQMLIWIIIATIILLIVDTQNLEFASASGTKSFSITYKLS
jgi:hypothetical protein